MKKFIKTISVLVLSLIMCFGVAGCNFIDNSGNGSYSGSVYPDSKQLSENVTITENETEEKPSLIKAVEKVARSVVAIRITKGSSSGGGSGVIVDIDDGVNAENVYYIITCHHVVSGGGNIDVYVPDVNGRNYGDDDYDTKYAFSGVIDNKIHNDKAVRLVGGDKTSDVAVLKLVLPDNSYDIVTAKIPTDDYVTKVGEEVFSVGNPTGELPGTVSHGIVSYINRKASVDSVGEMTLNQIDVQINPGNSGGGLFNYYGELVGITNAGNTDYDGINFAIPLTVPVNEEKGVDNGFKNISRQLIASATENNYGYISGRWALGVSVGEETNRYSGSYVYVSGVEEYGNFAIAGIKANDMINSVTYNGKTHVVTTVSSFSKIVTDMKNYIKVGDEITVNVSRHTLSVKTTADIKVTLYQYIFCNTGYTPAP